MSVTSRNGRSLWDRIRDQSDEIALPDFEERLRDVETVEREQSLRMVAPEIMDDIERSLGLQSLIRGGRAYRTVDKLSGEDALTALYDLANDWEIDDTVTLHEYDGARSRYEAVVTLRYEKSLPAKLPESNGNVHTVTDHITYRWESQRS